MGGIAGDPIYLPASCNYTSISCGCPIGLDVDYTSDIIPDALQTAYATMSINETNWAVEFTVTNVLALYHGHVLATKLDVRENVTTAFTPYVQNLDMQELWFPSKCSMSSIDIPADHMGIRATRYDNCTRSYTLSYSLVDLGQRNERCELVEGPDAIYVSCNITMSSVRAYDLTEPSAFLSAETTFSANISIPRSLNNEVSNLLYATLAKCNVINGPEFVIQCRVPGQWSFGANYTVVQNIPDWINPSSCVHSTTAVATFVTCGLNAVPVTGYTEASANLTATVLPGNDELTFSLDYTLPRAISASATGNLQEFIRSMGVLNEKYYYAGGDRATLYIEAVDTSRLEIIQLEMFNADSPRQVYDIRANPQFLVVETVNATHFLIEFRPSGLRQDSAFYRNGPHGVNVTLQFTAASRRQAAGETGNVVFDNIRVEGPRDANAAADDAGNQGLSSGAAGAVAAAVIAVITAIIVVSIIVIRRRRRHKLNLRTICVAASTNDKVERDDDDVITVTSSDDDLQDDSTLDFKVQPAMDTYSEVELEAIQVTLPPEDLV